MPTKTAKTTKPKVNLPTVIQTGMDVYDSLAAENEKLRDSLVDFEKENAKLGNRVIGVEDELSKAIANSASLEVENSNYREENTDLREKVKALDADVKYKAKELVAVHKDFIDTCKRLGEGKVVYLPFGYVIRIRKV